jgi:hypothetical protein
MGPFPLEELDVDDLPEEDGIGACTRVVVMRG